MAGAGEQRVDQGAGRRRVQVVGGGNRIEPVERLRGLPPLLLPEPVADTCGDPGQPVPKRRLAAVSVQAEVRLDEDVLHQFL